MAFFVNFSFFILSVLTLDSEKMHPNPLKSQDGETLKEDDESVNLVASVKMSI